MTLTAFTFEAAEVRTLTIDGEVWFVAADVATVLGYRMASDMTRNLDEDEKGTQILRTPGGEQSFTVITEPGLYEAILRSRIPQAQAFKRWVKHDVLPAIRRTGSYNAPAAMTFEEMTAHVIEGLNERIAAAEAKAAELESPAAAWRGLSQADGDFTVSDAAKILARDGISTGPRKLYDWLQAEGWVFKRGGRWQAMQAAINAGLLVERITSGYFDQSTGERRQADPQVRVTAAGLERLRSELAEAQTLAVVQ